MKKLTTSLLLMLFVNLLINSSCKKNDVLNPNITNNENAVTNTALDELVNASISSSFNYETSKEINLDITILEPDNIPVSNIPVKILNMPAELGGVILFKALTNDAGKILGNFKIPSDVEKIVVDPGYLGVIRNATVKIVNNTIFCTLGGISGYSGNVIPNNILGGRPANNPPAQGRPLSAFTYIGTYDASGKPTYLETPNEVISSTLLTNINATLPESQDVRIHHPDLLNSQSETNVNLIATSDIWITFVSEGAGYRNSFAYYTYPTNNPPASVSQIDSLHIIFPNASLMYSGGSLVAGNKVKIGRFNPGTSIGFALIADGWDGARVSASKPIFYSSDNLNPETNAALKRHSVLLWDNAQSLFLVGFDDQNRVTGGSDNDFNDCLFYVKSNPVDGISRVKVNPIDIPVDTDRDGVNDVYDDFPRDPLRAYINYYPGQNAYGTHAFEDKWPFLGDYDMNDLVVDYRYTVVSNAQNKAIEMTAKYVLQASGASYRNGFGVEFPFASTLVQSVTGTKVTNNAVVSFGANGCESGQTKAVIIPFDDALTIMNKPGGYMNTYVGSPFTTPDTINMNLTFSRPLTTAEFGTAPFNPFIIINKTRGREAHLPGYTPTQKMDTKFFKTGDDNTSSAQGVYFKTKTNLPWGIHFVEKFRYPAEGNIINAAYTKFISWAQSNGTSNTDWYKDATNTIESKLY
jgi:LruC domain-containing protein